jgi:HSP20 family protein
VPDTPRNPFEGVTDYFTELVRMRSVGIHGAAEPGTEHAERTHASAWVPATDIFAAGDDLVIRVELAGVGPEDVDLRYDHGLLTVSGVRASGLDDDAVVEFYTRERFYGAFRRVITLPEGTDASQITADFDNGLVEITVRGGVGASRSTRIAVADRSSAPTTRRVGDQG